MRSELGGYYFDVQRYRNSDKVRLMDIETRGLYREILDEIWITGSIPNDVDSISKLVNAPLDVVIRCWPQVHDCLIPTRQDPERFTSQRMEEERRHRNKVRRKRKELGRLGGVKSGETRRSKREAIASNLLKQNEATPIPIPIPNPIPIPTEELNPKPPKSPAPSALDVSFIAFMEFWNLYPRKIGKAAALKAWRKLNPQNGMREIIAAAIRKQRQWPQWLKDNGQFIPHPATWLNRGQWDDEEYRDDDRSKAIHDLLK